MARKKEEVVEEKPKVRKGAAPPSRDERAAVLKEMLNKKMKGKGIIKSASEYMLPFMTKRLPTGLLTLDVELRGGFPAGGISQIAGPKNSCKSWLYWQVIRQQQFYKGDNFKCLIAMTEMPADRGQAQLAGVKISLGKRDIEAIDEARQKNGLPAFTAEEKKSLQEEVGQIDEVHAEDAETLFDAVIKAVESGVYHLIVLDSLGAVLTAAQAEADSLKEKSYGGASGPISEMCKKLSALMTIEDDWGRARDVCVLAINQIRDNIGDPHKQFRTPGGQALNHAKFVDLWLRSGRKIGFEEPIMTPDGMKKRFQQTGKEVGWQVEKGKAGMHEGGTGAFNYDFRINTADFYLDTLVAGVRSGVVEASGAWIYLNDPTTGEEITKANGREAFVELLHSDVASKAAEGRNDTYMNLIRQFVFKKEGININYDWE
jgi:RecA/RadA recombinase